MPEFPSSATPALFSPIAFRDVVVRNRIGMAPMCQYSSPLDGTATDWHLAHLGARAVAGVGLIMTEATAVSPDGRISASDLGIWSDAQVPGLRRITSFLRAHGAVSGVQLAHAGRKASRLPAWEGGGFLQPGDGGWQTVAPSALAYDRNGIAVPREMTLGEIRSVVDDFGSAARRAIDAGFDIVEIHAAHGYLLHSFMSALSNTRDDEYGGDFDSRTRLLREVVTRIREVWGDRPLFVRLSVVEAFESADGWTLVDSERLTRWLTDHGVDLVDCSTGGLVPGAGIFGDAPGYQLEYAEALRRIGGSTAAVGGITEPAQAEAILREGKADLVLLGRELLRNPGWVGRAAAELGVPQPAPPQYFRAYRPGQSQSLASVGVTP